MTGSFFANGKLLLSGEYFVLDGAKALAIPVNYGQSLDIATSPSIGKNSILKWRALDHDESVWFEACFDLEALDVQHSSDSQISNKLLELISFCRKENPRFLKPTAQLPNYSGFEIQATTQLDFPKEWGLGTSSTLVSLIAQWAGVNPFKLQFQTFGGSGYDIACAQAGGPLLYQILDKVPTISECMFTPTFHQHLYFVYLGKKQNSREGIGRYRGQGSENLKLIDKISELTIRMMEASTFEEFNTVIARHETIIAKYLDLPRARQLYFPDYWGEVKSLGAWGGDFILVTSQESENHTKRYFNEKGYQVFIPFRDMVYYD